MIRDDLPVQGQAMVPPRPNLGPEPWSEPSGMSELALPWVLAIAGVVGFLVWRRSRRPVVAAFEDQASPEVGAEPLTDQARWIALADAIRVRLIQAHGPAWASKTTEEVAGDPSLVDRWGELPADRLVELLRIADRAKFAGDASDSVEVWEAFADQLVPADRVTSKEPERSATTGRRSRRSDRSPS